MTIKAVQGKVIVKPIQPDHFTDTGIYLPDQAVGQSDRGTVIDSGHPDINTGDIAVFTKNAGSRVVHEGEEFFILHPSEILVALEGA